MSWMPGRLVCKRSASALEFPSLLALLKQLASSDVGRRRVEGLTPFTTRRSLEVQRRRYEEALSLLGQAPWVPLLGDPLEPLLDRLEEGDQSIVGADLLVVARLLQITEEASERVRAAPEGCQALGDLLADVPDGESLRRQTVRILDRRGRVRDNATPRLAGLRRRVHQLREALHRDLRQTLESYREHLSEETLPFKDGRLVLLLKAGARGRVRGLVHGRSGSGRSVYFEPLEVVEPNNRLQEAFEEEASERRRVLAELVEEVRAARDLLRRHAELLAELDLLQVSWRFAELSGGRLAEISDSQALCLRGARHPLLDPRLAALRESALGQAGHTGPVVPLDLELERERRIMVVTGPNAGGKTVALKTTVLLALMHQCGLPIPVEPGSRLPWLTALTATIGDEQDLLSDRSTFSGRLLRWREAWSAASPESLVLLDELGSGTDPEEGAALSIALLEDLLEKRSLALVTTHLTLLAVAALERPGAVCAAMEFDVQSGQPTFRLRAGSPAGSKALALAARLGLPQRWIGRAEELLGREHRDLRRLMAEVEEVRRKLAAEQGRLERESDAVAEERKGLALEAEALRQERDKVATKQRHELDAFRRKVTERLRAEDKQLQAAYAQGRRRGLVGEAVNRLFEDAPLAASDGKDETMPIERGGWVRHRGLGWEGRVDKLRRGVAEVLVSGKRLRCRVDELAGMESRTEMPGAARPQAVLQRDEDDGAGAELNLVGWRVEPALDELDTYLDRALLATHRQVRVIHGFGSGRLRSAVRQHLRPHPAVASFRSGRADEGGDGATVVTLKEG
jgi:DNA mismatch repair protein MutS2